MHIRLATPIRLLLTLAVILLLGSPARAQLMLFHDRSAFTAAVASLSPILTDDYESYALGDIATGDRRGDFLYTSDTSITQPAIVLGGNGGQALGGSPFDVFVGGDSVRLEYQPLPASRPPVLRAFGADFLYAPSFDSIAGNTYRLGLGDGAQAGQFVGNLDGLDGAGGTFFLGIIADSASVFTKVDIFSVQVDPAFLVPAYQADNLIYSPVPEPSTICVLTLGGILLFTRLRYRK